MTSGSNAPRPPPPPLCAAARAACSAGARRAVGFVFGLLRLRRFVKERNDRRCSQSNTADVPACVASAHQVVYQFV